MPDDDLVRAAKAGDPDAWRELYRDHAGRLVVWLSTRGQADGLAGAEDVAADAWVVAAEKMHAFEGTADEFAGWLFGIARKISATRHRTTVRRATYATDTLEDAWVAPVPAPQESVAGDAWVRAQLAQLPPRERDVVGCIDGLGLDVAGTSRALGISAVAVRVARHRGLRKLRAAAGVQAPPDPALTADPS